MRSASRVVRSIQGVLNRSRQGAQVASVGVDEPERPPARAQPRHLAAGAALSVIADVGPLVAAGALSVVLARVVGPSGNGAFAVLVTLVSFTVLVCSLGLASGLTYEVSRG